MAIFHLWPHPTLNIERAVLPVLAVTGATEALHNLQVVRVNVVVKFKRHQPLVTTLDVPVAVSVHPSNINRAPPLVAHPAIPVWACYIGAFTMTVPWQCLRVFNSNITNDYFFNFILVGIIHYSRRWRCVCLMARDDHCNI